jgi:hypothetical protein
MFTHHPNELPIVIGYRHVPDVVRIHERCNINGRDVLCHADPRNPEVGDAGFDTIDQDRGVYAEGFESKTRLCIQLPAAGSKVPVRLGVIFKCRISDYTGNTVSIRLPVMIIRILFMTTPVMIIFLIAEL